MIKTDFLAMSKLFFLAMFYLAQGPNINKLFILDYGQFRSCSTELKGNHNTLTLSQVDGQNSSISKVIEGITSAFSSSGFDDKEPLSNRVYTDRPFNNQKIKKVVFEYRFVTTTEAGLKKSLDLLVYEYATSGSSLKAFEVIKVDPHLETYFKDNNMIMLYDEYILLIKSGCSLSKESWSKVKTNVAKSLSNIPDKLICHCGVGCDNN